MPPRSKNTPSASSATTPSRFRIPNIQGGHSATPKNSTYPIPPPRGDSLMTLTDVVGPQAAQQIEATGKLMFHAAGDTGRGPDSDEQAVAEAMAREVDPNRHHESPAFMLNLGDVIYGDGKRNLYADEFYRPYADYPNKV